MQSIILFLFLEARYHHTTLYLSYYAHYEEKWKYFLKIFVQIYSSKSKTYCYRI